MSNLPINPEYKNIKNFNDYINLIIKTLELPEDLKNNIIERMKQFNDPIKYSIISNNQIHILLDQALKADNELKEISKKIPEKVINQWNETKQLLGELQGLILLKNVNTVIETKDSSILINELLNAFNMKLTSVNQILKENLNSGVEEEEGFNLPTKVVNMNENDLQRNTNKLNQPEETSNDSQQDFFKSPLNDESKYRKYKNKYLNLKYK